MGGTVGGVRQRMNETDQSTLKNAKLMNYMAWEGLVELSGKS